MAHSMTVQQRRHPPGPSLWLFAAITVVLACGALIIAMRSPQALVLALIVGLAALGSRAMFQRLKSVSHARAEGSSAVANAGLAVATVAIAPLLAFALLWAALLVFLGATWILNAIGVI